MLIAWWLSIYLTFSRNFLRPFDDWKNGIFYVGIGIILIYSLWKNRSKPEFNISLVTLLSVLYVVWCLITLLIPVAPKFEGLLALSKIVLWMGLISIISKLDATHLNRLFKFSLTCAALIAFFNLLTYNNIIPLTAMDPNIVYPIGHITYYGDFMALNIPIGLFLFMRSDDIRGRILWGSAVAAVVFGLFHSATRASFLSVAVGIVFLTILFSIFNKNISLKKIVVTFLIFIVVSMGAFSLMPKTIRGESVIKRFLYSSESLVTRFEGFRVAQNIVEEKPLTGYGIGSFRFVYPEFASGANVGAGLWYMHPHNEILNQVVEVGFVGASLILLILLFLLTRGIQLLKLTDGYDQSLLMFAGMGVVISFISWQFSTNYLFPISRLITALYLGIIWKYVSAYVTNFCIIRKRWFLIIVMSIVIFCTLLSVGEFLSKYFVVASHRTTDPSRKTSYAEMAYKLSPGAFDSTFELASSYLLTNNFMKINNTIGDLYEKYPYVPAVLYAKAQLELIGGNTKMAVYYLQHALKNDPAYFLARDLLISLEKNNTKRE